MSKTLDAYNKSAEEYNKKISGNVPYLRQIDKFIDLFKSKSNILDMGCGTGINSRRFLEAGHNVLGFDFSEAMVELARKNCPDGVFSISTIQDFNIHKKFDGICLSFVIVHLTDQDLVELIDHISDLLTLDGYIYISFMTGKISGYETTSFSDSEIFFNYFDQNIIIELFKKNDFKLVYSGTEPYKEEDGSITEDVFLIFKRCENLA